MADDARAESSGGPAAAGGRGILERCPASCCRCSPPAHWARPSSPERRARRGHIARPRSPPRRPRSAGARCSPRRTPGTATSRARRWTRAAAAASRRSAAGSSCTRISAAAARTGFSLTIVPPTQPTRADRVHGLRRRVRSGPYPIPRERAGRGRRRTATCSSCSTATASCTSCSAPTAPAARWDGRPGAVFDLRTGALRPAGWTSADAAGLPILPGPRAPRRGRAPARSTTRCASPSPRTRGRPSSRRGTSAGSSVRTCRPWDCGCGSRRSTPRAGSTARRGDPRRAPALRADRGRQRLAVVHQRHGGRRWDDTDLEQIKRVPGSAFEAVRSGPLHGQ